MERLAFPHVPAVARAGWRRFVVQLVWRSFKTVLGYGAAALAVFAVAAVMIGDAGPSWLSLLFVPYVVLGAAAGANVGLVAAVRREARTIAEESGWLVGPLVDRAFDELAIPDGGIETPKLRELAELRELVPTGHSRLERLVAAFAVRRALEDAGVQALQSGLLDVVARAEARGDAHVGRDALEEAARRGLAAAVARELDVGWRVQRAMALGVAAMLFVSLPLIAVLTG